MVPERPLTLQSVERQDQGGPMEIEYAFLARAAEASPDGTLSMLGAGFEVVRSPRFPLSIPVSFVVRLNGIEDRTHTVTLEFDAFGEDGQSILDAPFVVPLEPFRQPLVCPVIPEKTANVVFVISGLLIPAVGHYRLVLKLTGENVVGREFRLIAEETRA